MIPSFWVSFFQSGISNGTLTVAGLSNLFIGFRLGMLAARDEEEEEEAAADDGDGEDDDGDDGPDVRCNISFNLGKRTS